MSQQGAALQSYNNELVKCKFLDCSFLYNFYFKNGDTDLYRFAVTVKYRLIDKVTVEMLWSVFQIWINQ